MPEQTELISEIPFSGRAGEDEWRSGFTEKHDVSDTLLDLIAARFRLLGEPLRLKILAALSSGERSVSDLVTLTGASQPNVSKHLNALSHGGLVRRRKMGTSIYYAIADVTVLSLCDIVCASTKQRLAEQARELGLQVQ